MNYSVKILRRTVLIISVLIFTAGVFALPDRLARLMMPTAEAAGFTWTGAVSTDWFTPGNWSPNGVPGVNDTATINFGTVDITADATVAVLRFGDGTILGVGTLTVTGTMSWTGGQMQGGGATIIQQGATLNVSGVHFKKIDGRRLENSGTININGTGQGFFGSNSFTLNNAGVINFGDGSNFILSGSPGTINNTGTLRKSAGADVSLIFQTLNNNGTVEVQTGTLQLGGAFPSGGGTSAGAFSVSQGATLQFSPLGVAHTLADTSSVTGAGNVAFGGGAIVHINGAYNLTGTTTINGSLGSGSLISFNTAAATQSLNFISGKLGGTGTLTVTGTMSWTGGQMQGGGATTIAAGATANVSTPSLKTLEGGRTFNNAGTLNLDIVGDSVAFCGGNFTLNNSGTLDIRGDGSISGCSGPPGVINNTGLFKKSAGGAEMSNVRHSFNNRGTVEALSGTLSFRNGYTQTAGTTLLNGGMLSVSSLNFPPGTGTLPINGGALIGTGVIEGNVINASTVSPGLAPNAAGTIRVTGNYTQTASGRLRIEIGGSAPGSQFDQLILGTEALTKTATLNGALDVQLVNNFTPAANDSFEVARYSARVNQFANINGLDIGNGQTFTPDYRPNNLVLISGAPGGGDTTGCGGPARIWVQIIAPRTRRLHNFRGRTLYKSTILYGNSGGTGTLALITAGIKNLRPEHVVTTEGISKEPLTPITDPAVRQAFESLPTVVTDSQTGKHYVPVLAFIPPDNPACRDAGAGGGDTGGGGSTSDGGGGASGSRGGGSQSFGVNVIVCSDCDGGGDGGGTGGGGGGGGSAGGGSGDGGGGGAGGGGRLGCDPDFISENDVRATQVDTSRIAECMPAIGDLLRELTPGNDCLQTAENIGVASGAYQGGPVSLSGAVGSVIECAASLVPAGTIASAVAGAVSDTADGIGGAQGAAGAAVACRLGPDGFDRNETNFVFSCDPNDKVGSNGAGEAKFITGEMPIPYAVFFENKPEASAPAQDVVITDQLDTSKLDLSTFQLGAISFGDKTVVPPAGRSEFNTEVDLRPDTNLLVRINAKLDKATGLLTWRFASIDPDTLQSTEDPLAGFLPPNRTPSEGEGSVLFTVSPKQNLASGTEIRNGARIVFDTNAPIDTPVWLNTIDNAKPSSRVQPLPATSNTESFTVQWSGADAHSGIANFSIFVSEDGGPFQFWLRNTTDTSAVFQGQQGKTYGFYSLARDNTGNMEDAKAAAEATTAINTDGSSPVTTVTFSYPANANGWHNADVTISLNSSDTGSGVKEIGYTVTGAQSFTGETVSGASATIPITAEGTTTITFFARDIIGNTEAAQTLTVRLDKTAPVITATRAPTANEFGWNNSDVTATASADDSLSGLDTQGSTLASVIFNGDGAGQSTTFVAVDKAGNSARTTVGDIDIDKTAPAISCGSPDGLWHASDVSIGCTANGGASGLINASDASFSLATSVALNTEMNHALTDSRTVTDRAGNTSKAGPIGGNRVDKKAPRILIDSPTNASYLIKQVVTASYSCADGGSGVAAGGCTGTVASGGPLDTSAVGMKVFTAQATDVVGNTATLSISYAVTYKIHAFYDETKGHMSGSTVPVKIRLMDANGVNLSSESIIVTAQGTSLVSTYVPEEAEDAGNANPNSNFRFTAFDGSGGYIYNLKTTGLTTGTYVLIFRVAGDPITHTTEFRIR